MCLARNHNNRSLNVNVCVYTLTYKRKRKRFFGKDRDSTSGFFFFFSSSSFFFSLCKHVETNLRFMLIGILLRRCCSCEYETLTAVKRCDIERGEKNGKFIATSPSSRNTIECVRKDAEKKNERNRKKISVF